MSQARRVLVVDDDALLRALLRQALEDEGHVVATAGNGEEALDVLGLGYTPDVILLDVEMPVMDGPAFAVVYEGLPGPRARVVWISAAYGPGALGALAAELGVGSEVLPKPFDLDALGLIVAGPTVEATIEARAA